jgi:predicted enzyme related to lactoylglutathione lyase
MKRVTGLGGVFFKTNDPAKLKSWYARHLGFITTEWGASMLWEDINTKQTGRTEWSPFKSDTDYFDPGTAEFMINYRVDDLVYLLDVLNKEGVTIVGERQEFEYGKFGWIMDPEERKIELWEPVDEKLGDDPPLWTERVTGLGGIFFKSKEPKGIKNWYEKHLGVGETTFQWNDLNNKNNPKVPAQTIWSPFKHDTDYFSPSEKSFMFNYRVNDLEVLISKLKSEGVSVVGSVESFPYGKFGWVMDPDGNKIELWEPIDDGFGSH